LIGMGAVFAGAARAPITALIIMFELTGDYSIILPLMAAIVLATGVSNLLSRDTIYTLKLRRRGIDLEARPTAAALAQLRVRDAVQPVGTVVDAAATLTDAAAQLEGSPLGQLAVVDRAGRYVGVLTAQSVADEIADGAPDTATAQAAAQRIVAVDADLALEDALDELDACAVPALPVLAPADGSVIGWLSSQGVLSAIRRREIIARPAAGPPHSSSR
jgi:CIC family chloride channel protein